ncbi:hypothetical protein DV735_g2637, partial [Chaetothyriales sp. CBS 134920]
MVWPLPESDKFEIRAGDDSGTSGRGVYSRQRLAAGTHILTTTPDQSPIAHVVLRIYRKEVCAWCFAYDRGRVWKHRRHGFAFCNLETCYPPWLDQNQGRLTVSSSSPCGPVDADIAHFLLSDNGSESLLSLVADTAVFKPGAAQEGPGLSIPSAERSQELVSRAAHNAFSIRPTNDGDQSGEFLGYGVWPEASFFNHSCRPTVRKARQGRCWAFWVDGEREIGPGQELTITYLGGDERELTVEERRKRLQDEWSFRCCCPRCVEEGGP